MENSDFSQADIEFHRQTADQYDDTIVKEYSIYHSYYLYPWINKMYDTNREMRFLDIGCGTGLVSLALAKKGFNVIGLDHSPEMINIAKRKARSLNLQSKIEFIIGDVEHLEFENETFDGVTCQGILHHLRDMQPALSEMHRVLKHKGNFFISEPCDDKRILKKGIMALQHTVQFLRKSSKTTQGALESEEAPIEARELFFTLNKFSFKYKYKFLTHLPFIHKVLPNSARLLLVKILSFPWRNSKGGLVFLFGEKQ